MSPSTRDRGSVTAETAVVLPVLVLLLGAVIGVLAVVSAQLRCAEAARAAARAAARGEATPEVRARAREVAGASSAVRVERSRDETEVVVTTTVEPLGGALRLLLPAFVVQGRAVAATEPGVVAGVPP